MSRPLRWTLRALAGLWLLSALGLGVVLFAVGRHGIIERFTFAPELLAPHAASISVEIDGKTFARRLPEPRRWQAGAVPVVAFADEEAARALVFVCPGAAGAGKSHAAELWMDIRSAGLVTASFDHPAMQRAGEGVLLAGLEDAAREALVSVRARWPDAPLVVVGTSLGATTAATLAAEFDARALVLDTPADLAHEIHRRTWLNALPPLFLGTRAFFEASVPASLDLQAALARVPAHVPVLVSVGTEDPIVDPAVGRQIAQARGAAAQVWEAEGRYHALVLTHSSFRQHVHQWLRFITPGLDEPWAGWDAGS